MFVFRIFYTFSLAKTISTCKLICSRLCQLFLIYYHHLGGLKMLDIECMIKAQRIICLKKYIEDYVSPWKILLDYYLGNVGGKFILKCQFDTCKLPISLPVFYKDCFDAWSFLAKTDIVTYGDIMNQVIWSNKNILSQGKTIYQPLFHKCGRMKSGRPDLE